MQSDNSNRYNVFEPTAGNLLGTLLITFFVMLLITGFMQSVISSVISDWRTAFLLGSVLQALFVFMFPSWLAAKLCCRDPKEYLGLRGAPDIRPFIGISLLLILFTPSLNALVEWNASLSLPDSLSSIESELRKWEDNAAATTERVLGDSSIWGLVSGVLVIGCVTGFAEEMFFRAGLQRALIRSHVNHHVAVWTAAVIFSAVHFQFFGFVPRMIIGALLGYVYFYTGSLWVAAFGHAFNNSLVVITSWLSARGYIGSGFDKVGSGCEGDLWIAAVSLLLTLAFIFICGRKFFCVRRPVNFSEYGKK